MDCKCQIYVKYPVEDMDVVHCVCENCGNEWVE